MKLKILTMFLSIFTISANSFGLIIQDDKQGESRLAFADQHTRYNIGENVMAKRIEYRPNQIINGLTFLYEVAPILVSNKKTRKARFRCYCGIEFESIIGSVRSKHTNSCGCYHKKRTIEACTKHGLCKTPLYNIWLYMKDRCYNKNMRQYKDYGGRGITICNEWRNNPEAFIGWGKDNGFEKGLEIDRRDNNGNYEPSNCRFVTHAVNNQNRGNNKLNWDKVREIRNAKLLIPDLMHRELADAYGVSGTIIGDVLNNKIWKEV